MTKSNNKTKTETFISYVALKHQDQKIKMEEIIKHVFELNLL